MAAISNDWLQPLSNGFKKDYYRKLYQIVKHEYEIRKVFPAPDDAFNAFVFTSLTDVRAVILEQGPYHSDEQAHGLHFSVEPNVEIPPSPVNIYQELHGDLGCRTPNNGYLKKWADQGVMLLNTVLTVCVHQANSHHDIGWEELINAVVKIPNEQNRPMVFIFRGRPAWFKKSMLSNPRYMILETLRPSPLSMFRGFSGSRPFGKTNVFPEERGLALVDWQIENLQNRHSDRKDYVRCTVCGRSNAVIW